MDLHQSRAPNPHTEGLAWKKSPTKHNLWAARTANARNSKKPYKHILPWSSRSNRPHGSGVVLPPKLRSSLTKRSNVSQQPRPSVGVNACCRSLTAPKWPINDAWSQQGKLRMGSQIPAQNRAQELDQRARKASRPFIQGSIYLPNLLEGGITCLESVVGTGQALLWLKRKCQERWTPFQEQTSKIAAEAKSWLTHMGWHISEQGWRHPILDKHIQTAFQPSHTWTKPHAKNIAHLCRESWRTKQWKVFLDSGRREAKVLGNWPYQEARFTHARSLAKTTALAWPFCMIPLSAQLVSAYVLSACLPSRWLSFDVRNSAHKTGKRGGWGGVTDSHGLSTCLSVMRSNAAEG